MSVFGAVNKKCGAPFNKTTSLALAQKHYTSPSITSLWGWIVFIVYPLKLFFHVDVWRHRQDWPHLSVAEHPFKTRSQRLQNVPCNVPHILAFLSPWGRHFGDVCTLVCQNIAFSLLFFVIIVIIFCLSDLEHERWLVQHAFTNTQMLLN